MQRLRCGDNRGPFPRARVTRRSIRERSTSKTLDDSTDLCNILCMDEATLTGERRHERCRFGAFSSHAVSIDLKTGAETPFAMPLCSYELPTDIPPAIARKWGGAIEFDRDCAVCPAYAPL